MATLILWAGSNFRTIYQAPLIGVHLASPLPAHCRKVNAYLPPDALLLDRKGEEHDCLIM